MPKSRQYHEDAILYNEVLAEAAETVAKEIKDPEIQKWPTSVGKQHRFHASRHKKALVKLDKGEPYAPVEIIPEGLDLNGGSVFDPINPEETEDTRSVAEQQAEFAASQVSEDERSDAQIRAELAARE